MTLSSETVRISYAGNGSTTAFPITFIYWDNADILAVLRSSAGVETTWIVGTNYTLSGGNGTTGTLTATVAPASGTTLVITSNRELLQQNSYPLGGDFPSTIAEQTDDKGVRLQQQIKRDLDRSLKWPLTDSTSLSTTLPSSIDRAGMYLGFDASGNVIATTGVGSDASLRTDLASETVSSGDALIKVKRTATGATGLTLHAWIEAQQLNVKEFGAVGDGVTNDTAAINAAIAAAKTLTYGATVYLPQGSYAVTEINATSATSSFVQTIRLKGAGRAATRIIPFAAGGVLLNMLGSNNMVVEDLSIDSAAAASQCGIFMARSTTSTNCNNNKFANVFVIGSYTKASVVCNGSESSNWFGCRFENTNATPNYRTLWTGGATGIRALQSITVVNGGTIADTNNPNTDNKMFGCEFYAPFTSAYPVRFSQASSYTFVGCSIICGTSDTCRLVTYGDPTGSRFNGPITWIGCHFEVFGTGNVVHYLNGSGAQVTFDGINSYGGYYVASNSTAFMDYDRTTVAEQPILSSSTWTTPTTSPNSTGSALYLYVALACNLSLHPNGSDGTIYLSGYAQQSVIDAMLLLSGGTRFISGGHSSWATALPTTGTYTVGELIYRETPVAGQPTGWRCTVSGTLGTLNGGLTTGGITIGTNVLVVSSATGMQEGQRIDVAGSGAGPYYIRKLSGTTAYLDGNAGATVAAAAVSFSNATLVALANL